MADIRAERLVEARTNLRHDDAGKDEKVSNDRQAWRTDLHYEVYKASLRRMLSSRLPKAT